MKKNCETCKHDDGDCVIYPLPTPCDECIYTSDAPSKWEAAEYYEPDNNADRIRDMNNNDLAKHLVEIGWDCHLCSEHERLDNEPLSRCEKCDEQCAKHCLEWLQKPAE